MTPLEHGHSFGNSFIAILSLYLHFNEQIKNSWIFKWLKKEKQEMSISQIVDIAEKAPGLIEQGLKVVGDVKTVLAKFETDPDAQKTLADVLALEGQVRAIVEKQGA